ncbi:Nuclear transcription factor Y subunit B-4, partial [Ananas comosus]
MNDSHRTTQSTALIPTPALRTPISAVHHLLLLPPPRGLGRISGEGSMAEFAAPGTPDSGHSGDLGGTSAGGGGGGSREHDRFLPIANIGRIMRKAIPENGKISKDAKESIQECVSEFISFVTSEASDKCQREKRKTINGDDLLWAMGTLGFEDYVEPLKLYLQLYREGDSKGSRSADQSGKKEGVINGDPGAS